MKVQSILSALLFVYLLAASFLIGANYGFVTFSSGIPFTASILIATVTLYILQRPSMKEKRYLKLLSFVCVVMTSQIYHALTNPCNLGRIRCDFFYGFPFSFWLVSDFIDPILLVYGILAFAIDMLLWMVLLTFLLNYFHIGWMTIPQTAGNTQRHVPLYRHSFVIAIVVFLIILFLFLI